MGTELTIADVLIGIVVLVSAAIGLARGLFKEVLSLATWVLALVLSLLFAPTLGPQWVTFVNGDVARSLIAFVVIFGAVLIAGALVRRAVARVVESTGLTGTDRVLGLLFGSLRGIVVCVVALIALRPFVAEQDWWQDSALIPELIAFEEDVLALLGQASSAMSRVREQV